MPWPIPTGCPRRSRGTRPCSATSPGWRGTRSSTWRGRCAPPSGTAWSNPSNGPPGAGPAWTRLEIDEVARELRARFDALPPEHRRVIGLRQFEGLSARDTARRMGRTEAAVHSLYRRALLAWNPEGLEDGP